MSWLVQTLCFYYCPGLRLWNHFQVLSRQTLWKYQIFTVQLLIFDRKGRSRGPRNYFLCPGLFKHCGCGFFSRFYSVRLYENLKYLCRFRLVQLLIGRSCWGKMGRSCQSQRIYDLEKVPNSKKRLLKVPTKTFPRRLSTLFDLSKWKVDTEGQKGCWG